MKIVIVLSFVALSISTASIINFDDSLDDEWRKFKSLYNKIYADDIEDYMRKQIYKSNKMIITNHNEKFSAGNVTYSLAMNQFGDLTLYEFSKKMNGLKSNLNGKEKNYIKKETKDIFNNCKKDEIPIAEDWRKKGYVTPVKDQKSCGSCWAFSATGSLEGQHFRNSSVLVSLSEQNLIDCSSDYYNDGCDGGLMVWAFEYINDNKGIDTEESYLYEAKNDVCRYNSSNSGATDIGYVEIPVGDEYALLCAVATVGPVSVALDSTSHEFQFYHNGLFYYPNCSSTKLDHGLLAVGYDTNENGSYWIVKNSWGTHWGDNGYIHMARNRNNNCGIATMASYPLV